VTDSPSRAQRLANRQAASAASLSLHMSQPTQEDPVITQASTQLNKEVAAAAASQSSKTLGAKKAAKKAKQG
jgi:hypothetical protein